MKLREQIPDDPPRMGRKVLLLATIPVPYHQHEEKYMSALWMIVLLDFKTFQIQWLIKCKSSTAHATFYCLGLDKNHCNKYGFVSSHLDVNN